MPDPESYSSPGYIDVLYIDEQQQVPSKRHGHVNVTPGYSRDQYDDERWLSVTDAAIRSKNREEKGDCRTPVVFGKRKRLTAEIIDPTSNKSHHSSSRHESTWKAFQYYLDKCIPVKVHNVSQFRLREDDTDDDGQTSREIMSDEGAAVAAAAVLPLNYLQSLPSEILDKIVTVQCAFAFDSTQEPPPQQQQQQQNTEWKSPQEIDRDISFCNKDDGGNNNIPITFMGQEDQITSEMRLREVLSWNNEGTVIMPSTDEERRTTPQKIMSVCIAQETILTRGDSLIHVELDGRVEYKRQTMMQNGKEVLMEHEVESSNQQPLSCLIETLRLPSYLLLGNPNDQHNNHLLGNNNNNNTVSIHDINLWHAPQNCCSNVHYDDRHNLLMVIEGVKTVELCPPDCMEPSTITSEHANHPAVLRRRTSQSRSAVRDILEKKRDATHIVSISAGEALYIPPGWWHRVGSTQTCTAINVWFDYNDTTMSGEVPRHMIAFRIRQQRRKHFEDCGTELAASYLERLRCEPLDRGIMSDDAHKYIKDFSPLREILQQGTTLDTSCVQLFIKLFIQCWDKVMNVQSETANEMNWKLKPASCYVITEAWERHVVLKCGDGDSSRSQEEVEMSYKHFFSMFDDSAGKVIRLFLIDGVETFREESYTIAANEM
eukprot:scaffold61931_cov50-Cyclotella_meneghiniana.AAC.2